MMRLLGKSLVMGFVILLIGLFSLPAEAAETELYFPAVAHVRGGYGELWKTDLWLFNPSNSITIEIVSGFLPAGRTNPQIREAPVILSPRRGVALMDVVANTFNEEAGGGIRLRSSQFFLASSTTYVGESGYYSEGFSIPAIGTDYALSEGALLQLANYPGQPGFRTNVGFLNPSNAGVDITLTLIEGSTGAKLGTGQVSLAGLGQSQISDIFSSLGKPYATTSSGIVEFSASSPVFAYATIIDNVSDDPTYVAGVSTSIAEVPDYLFLAAAHATGANGESWITDAQLYNPSDSPATARLSFLLPGTDNRSATEKQVMIPPQRVLELDDVVASTFGYSGGGAIHLLSDRGLLGSSRTYNRTISGSYAETKGFSVPMARATTALTQGIIGPLAQGLGLDRSNVAFLNSSEQPTSIHMNLIDAGSGNVFGTASLMLLPKGFGQINDIFGTVGNVFNISSNVTLEFSASAPVFSFATVIDQGSGDAHYVSAWPDNGSNSGLINHLPEGHIVLPTGNINLHLGQSLACAATASDPDGDTNLTYYWSFGDGSSSTLLNPPPHIFNYPGLYRVTFSVTDSKSAYDPTPDTRLITVDTIGGTFHGVGAEWQTEVRVAAPWEFPSDSPARSLSSRGMAIDLDGRIHVVYTNQTGSFFHMYYARSVDGGSTWTAWKDIIGDTSIAALRPVYPSISVGPDNTLHVAWNDWRENDPFTNGPYRIYYMRSFDGGITWEHPRRVSGQHAMSAELPCLSVDLNGRVHLVWQLRDPSSSQAAGPVYYTRSLDGGTTFEAPRQLSATGGPNGRPRFSISGTNGDLLAIAWQDERVDPRGDVYLDVSIDGGRTFSERVGQASSDREEDPDAIISDDGAIHLAYTRYGSNGAVIEVRNSNDGAISWSPPVVLSEARSRYPAWASPGRNGTLWLFWRDERDGDAGGTGNSRGDIAARSSGDAGLTWSPFEFVTDLGGIQVGFPSPALSPDERLYVMWSDERYGPGTESIFVKSRVQTSP